MAGNMIPSIKWGRESKGEKGGSSYRSKRADATYEEGRGCPSNIKNQLG